MDSCDAASVTQRLPIALTIAGSDSGGGAGIQADLKTFAAFGVYGASVVTALTAQNTRGVRAIHYPPPGIVGAQIEAVLEDFAVRAIKIGMLGSAGITDAAAEALLPSGEGGSTGRLQERPSRDQPGRRVKAFIIYDPVMVASSGDALSGGGFVDAIGHRLLPLVDCLTPNLAEAARLLNAPMSKSEADMARQGTALLKLGPSAILMKGGHLEGEEAVDLLVTENGFAVSRRRDLLPKTCMEPAARSRAPSPPASSSGPPCRRLWPRPRRSCASRSSAGGMSG